MLSQFAFAEFMAKHCQGQSALVDQRNEDENQKFLVRV